ncbi:MAG: ABC transporter ATP-binding protein [Gemmatimonadota bacterium]|nr:ABC transporter ATP-binding protein [Gemmatimonadota bacterium]
MTATARLIDVKKTYMVGAVEVPAVRGVSIDIEGGSFLSIAGPSGSGKTTILNLLGALDTPTAGTIEIGERTTAGMSSRDLADFRNTHLGFVFQTFNLIPVLTVLENVEFPLQLHGVTDQEERKEKVEQILKEVGLDTMADRRPPELSGGQQQRVAIARALVKNPTLVLADEPTANLDSVTATDIIDLMQEMNEKHGTTFVFSTHDPMVMERATRLIRLRDGKVESDERRNGGSNAS